MTASQTPPTLRKKHIGSNVRHIAYYVPCIPGGPSSASANRPSQVQSRCQGMPALGVSLQAHWTEHRRMPRPTQEPEDSCKHHDFTGAAAVHAHDMGTPPTAGGAADVPGFMPGSQTGLARRAHAHAARRARSDSSSACSVANAASQRCDSPARRLARRSACELQRAASAVVSAAAADTRNASTALQS